MKSKKAWEVDLISALMQGIAFVFVIILLILFVAKVKPSRAEQASLQVLAEKYPDERSLLYLTDDNGYALTDLMGRELLIGGELVLQGDYSTTLQDISNNVFESPFYGVSNSKKTCSYPSLVTVMYDQDYDVSKVPLSDYLHCYVMPKKIGRLFMDPIDLDRTYEIMQSGDIIVSAWAENKKIYDSTSWKGQSWSAPSEISGSDDGYLPLLTNDSTNLYLVWLKVYPDNYVEIAYKTSPRNVISWSDVSPLNKNGLCYALSPLKNACGNAKVKGYWDTVRMYVEPCGVSGCTKYNKLRPEYNYLALPSTFKEKRDYNYYLSRIGTRYRIDLSYDDGTTKKETIYGSEKIIPGEGVPIEFAPPAGFTGTIKMRMTTQ